MYLISDNIYCKIIQDSAVSRIADPEEINWIRIRSTYGKPQKKGSFI